MCNSSSRTPHLVNVIVRLSLQRREAPHVARPGCSGRPHARRVGKKLCQRAHRREAPLRLVLREHNPEGPLEEREGLGRAARSTTHGAARPHTTISACQPRASAAAAGRGVLLLQLQQRLLRSFGNARAAAVSTYFLAASNTCAS